MEYLGKFFFALITVFVASIIGGYVFSTLWGWLVVPVFKVQTLTTIQCIGLSFFINYILAKPMKEVDKDVDIDTDYFIKILIVTIIWGALGLFAGWVTTLFQHL